MAKILHVLTEGNDPLAAKFIEEQRKSSDEVETVDLSKEDADYKSLLEKIFASDSVEVW